MRNYTVWISGSKERNPKNRKIGEINANTSVEAFFAGLKKVNWDSVDVGCDIEIRDEDYYVESGDHGIVFSVHVGWDPLRDQK